MLKRTADKQPLKKAIDEWLSGHPMAKKAKETRIVHLWGQLLGPSVKNRTTSIYLSKGKLHVKVESAALRNELLFAKEKIMENLNAELGENIIEDIVLK